MPRILALDTATEACSAAVLDGERLIARSRIAPREHAQLILTMVREVLDEANLALSELDAIAFGRGPGGFTGVRIATGVVQGLAFGAGKPVIPVSTLRALAQGAARDAGASAVIAAIDARMGEVYVGNFVRDDKGLMQPAGEERVCAPGAVSAPPRSDWVGTGSGWNEYREALASCVPVAAVETLVRYPDARDIAILAASDFLAGLALPADKALPVYLRDQVADKPKPKS